jgi:hypothetical protein
MIITNSLFYFREDLGSAKRRLPRSASTHLLSRKPMMRSGPQRVDIEEKYRGELQRRFGSALKAPQLWFS